MGPFSLFLCLPDETVVIVVIVGCGAQLWLIVGLGCRVIISHWLPRAGLAVLVESLLKFFKAELVLVRHVTLDLYFSLFIFRR